MLMSLEISTQHIPTSSEYALPPALSRPLYELEGLPFDPTGHTGRHPALARWPVSNDNFAREYVESSLRTETTDFRDSPNRVAFIVGEGSLNTSILYLPEDTIILCDISAGACSYMSDYVDALRRCETPNAWLRQMSSTWQSKVFHDSKTETISGEFGRQAGRWNKAGYAYSLTDTTTYTKAHEAALSKAIIPWRMDITDPNHLERLAGYLNTANATITFVNLTNLTDYVGANGSTAEVAASLAKLRVSDYAPILARIVRVDLNGIAIARHLSGPFFGVNNLRLAP